MPVFKLEPDLEGEPDAPQSLAVAPRSSVSYSPSPPQGRGIQESGGAPTSVRLFVRSRRLPPRRLSLPFLLFWQLAAHTSNTILLHLLFARRINGAWNCAPLLADDLVCRRSRNQMRKSFQGDRGSVLDQLGGCFLQAYYLIHLGSGPLVLVYSPLAFWALSRSGANTKIGAWIYFTDIAWVNNPHLRVSPPRPTRQLQDGQAGLSPRQLVLKHLVADELVGADLPGRRPHASLRVLLHQPTGDPVLLPVGFLRPLF
jgi:hypothetical protein